MIRPRSCRVIYYFDTPAFGIRYQSFDRVNRLRWENIVKFPYEGTSPPLSCLRTWLILVLN